MDSNKWSNEAFQIVVKKDRLTREGFEPETTRFKYKALLGKIARLEK